MCECTNARRPNCNVQSTKFVGAMYLYEDESQYFGFFPLNFVDSLAESSYDLVYTVMDRFITVVLSSEESGLVSSHQLEEVGKNITVMHSDISPYLRP